MILFIALLAIAALVGGVGTVLDLMRDGYRRVPTRPEAEWAADPVETESGLTRS